MIIRKPRKTEVILLLVLLLILVLPSLFFSDRIDYDYRHIPFGGYSTMIAEDLAKREDFINADTDGKMDIYYDYLIYISENGYDDLEDRYYAPVIDPDLIYVDWQNKTISIFEQCESAYAEDIGLEYGAWYKVDFNEMLVVECDVNEEIYFFTLRAEFKNADIDTQVVMLCGELESMCASQPRAQRMNENIVDGSISVDRNQNTVLFKITGDSSYMCYSFDTGLVTCPDTGWVYEGPRFIHYF